MSMISPSSVGVLRAAKRRAACVASLAALAALFVACGNAAPSGDASGSSVQQLSGHLSPAWRDAPTFGHLEGSTPIHLAIALPVRDATRLQSLAAEVGDPDSPTFQHFMSHEQIVDELAPSQHDYDAVQRWAEAFGLKVVATYSNRLLVDVVGSAVDVERALHVRLERAARPNGTRFFRPMQEPSIDLSVPILGIAGLDTYVEPHHHGGSMPPGGNTLYGSSDVRNAYVSTCKGLTGAGQSVGIFSLDGYNKSDVTKYRSVNGITNAPALNNVLFGTSTGHPSGADVETVGDIEMAIAMAPGLSAVNVFMAPDCTWWSSMMTAATGIAHRATLQFSTSYTCWAGGSAQDLAIKQAMAIFAAQGQSFFYPSGDSGGMTANMQWPDYPGMTVVGATSLTMNGNGASYASEVPWTDASAHMGSGGGTEFEIALPAFQIGFATNGASTQYRNIPDVAIVGQNMFVVGTAPTAGSFFSFEGTSASAPLWAGYAALANQRAAQYNLARIGPANPMMYKVAKAMTSSSAYYPAFTDITSGTVPTDWPMGITHSAGAGYDLVSGLGTPTCNLVDELVCAYRNASTGLCMRAAPCPAGYSWSGKACMIGKGGCFGSGRDCSSSSQCCGGLVCNTKNQEFVCTPPNCSAVNLPCQIDADCCSLSCDPNAGFCN